MKNICFLVGDLNRSGGTERVTTLIANKLSEREKYKISILSLTGGLAPFFSLKSDISLYSLYEEKKSFKTKLFGVVWNIRQFVKSRNIDTLIVVDSISCIFTIPALYGLNVNHICWEHFNFKNNNGAKLRDFSRRLAAKYCTSIVTLTNKDMNYWKDGIKNINADLVCIYNPSPFQYNENIPTLKYKTVLSVGRLVNVKGYDLLIRAWEKVIQAYPDWILLIVGSGPEEEKLKQLAKDLMIEKSIIFPGHTNDVESYYKKSSFFCLSSRNEGLPMVLLEAQSYNLPIVAFDCDTGPSDIVDHGLNGYLVEERNYNELAYYLTKIIASNEEGFLNFSHNIDIGKFSINNIVTNWEEIL